MFKRKRNAFTLIELVAVLVIMAIIALIVTPLVMSIIRKARISADKRSVDAYGRSIELSIAGYLMDNGSFPTSIEQLTIEYSGDEVVCTTTNLNADSSVYLAGCTVGGRSVEGYTYGKEETAPAPTYTAYSVGDHVSYNGVTYYVIEESDATNDTVKLLKENPLTVDEVNLYLTQSGLGGTSTNINNYGGTSYYISDNCSQITGDTSGCINDYEQSNIKKIVDLWGNDNINNSDFIYVGLISIEQASDIFKLQLQDKECGSCGLKSYVKTSSTPNWAYSSNYSYWINGFEKNTRVWSMLNSQKVESSLMSLSDSTIRPMIIINKSADITKID